MSGYLPFVLALGLWVVSGCVQSPIAPPQPPLLLTATHTHITPHKKFRGTNEIGQLGDYINELDFHVGEIMSTLETLGLDDNTILFFSSDNGGTLKDHSSARVSSPSKT